MTRRGAWRSSGRARPGDPRVRSSEPAGAARTREELARATHRNSLHLTSMAWDAIEAADLDELAFLFGAVCIYTPGWELHHAVRAVLENRALRRA